MARKESSREDLLGEAVALIERIELVPRGTATTALTCIVPQTPFVAGFRACGALSLFFGEDPVYQFNAQGELRRAHRHGLLYKAAGGRLASLQRLRSESKTELVRRDLSDAEQAELINNMLGHLRDLATLLSSGDFAVTGQMPPHADVLGRLRRWLVAYNGLPIAKRPNVAPPRASAEKR